MLQQNWLLFRSDFQIFSRASSGLGLITPFPLTPISLQFSSLTFPSISTKVGDSRRSGPPSLQANQYGTFPLHSIHSFYLTVSSSQATSLRPQAAGSAFPCALLNRKTLLLLLKHVSKEIFVIFKVYLSFIVIITGQK